MQVSHTSDFITHASIGAGKVSSFKIAQSAEFFQVLANTLYSQKELATVREVLCNAWDAHIAAERTDTAVEITLTDDEVIFRDFGTGIAPERMEEVYLTLGGGSTKTHDGSQTGGFGLGSAAPFAFVDHFEVTSCFEGTKTIYNLSLSSPENDGKPAAITILSLPTTETGLQVKIGLRGAADHIKFANLIKQITYFGQMKVKLNGEDLPTLAPDAFENGFVVDTSQTAGFGLYVRYGSVIYPIERHEEYRDNFRWLRDFVEMCFGNGIWGNSTVVLQAPAHLISVTPSRESLSMTDRTISTIKQMLADVRGKLEKRAETRVNELLKESIDHIWRQADFRKLFNFYPIFPDDLRADRETAYSDPQRLADRHAQRYFRDSSEMGKRYQKMCLDALIQAGFDKTGLVRKFRKVAWKNLNSWERANWFNQTTIQPLIKGLIRTSLLSPDRLMVATTGYQGVNFTKPLKVKMWDFGDTFRMLRGCVILSYSKFAVERARHYPDMKFFYGDHDGTLVYIAQRKTGHLEAAREFFTKRGFTVIDATQMLPGEKPVVKEPAKPKLKVADNLAVSAVLQDRKIEFCNLEERAKTEQLPLVEKPEFWVMASTLSKEGLWHPAAIKIVKLYGDRGILVRSPSQKERQIKQGIPQLDQWLLAQLEKEYRASPALRRTIANDYHRDDLGTDHRFLWRAHYIVRHLEENLGLSVELSDREQRIKYVFEDVRRSRLVGKPEYESLMKYIGSIKPSAALKKLCVMLKSPMLNCIDITNFDFYLTQKTEKPEVADAARRLILFALKG